MNRRGFLAGLFATVAASFAVKAKVKPNVYWTGTRVPISEPMPIILQQDVINARIDELSMRLHPPYVAYVQVARIDKLVEEVTGKCEYL